MPSEGEHEFTQSLPQDSSKGCPTGYHKRSAQKSPTGKQVPSRCVRSTTVQKNTSREFKAKEARRTTRRLKPLAPQVPSIRSLSRKVCPPGMIERRPQVRKYSTTVRQKGQTVHKKGKTFKVYPKKDKTQVAPKCVKDRGLPGKGSTKKAIGPLRKGELSKHGYSQKLDRHQRHEALRSAVKEFGALGVQRKLNAVSKLMVRTAPDAAETFATDRNWMRQAQGPLKAF